MTWKEPGTPEEIARRNKFGRAMRYESTTRIKVEAQNHAVQVQHPVNAMLHELEALQLSGQENSDRYKEVERELKAAVNCHMCHGDLKVLVNYVAQPCPNKTHKITNDDVEAGQPQ